MVKAVVIEQAAPMRRPGPLGPADGDVLGALRGDANDDSDDGDAKQDSVSAKSCPSCLGVVCPLQTSSGCSSSAAQRQLPAQELSTEGDCLQLTFGQLPASHWTRGSSLGQASKCSSVLTR